MQQQTRSIEDQAGSERTTIDQRELPEPDQRARALTAYDSLSPGQRLELIAQQRPRFLFAELPKRHACAFYWWPLENGTEVSVDRKSFMSRGTERSLSDRSGL